MRRKCRRREVPRVAVFVACRDSAATVRAEARKAGVNPGGFRILSMKDNPELRTFDDVVKALPRYTGLVSLDNLECLLPPGKRNLAGAREFLRDQDKRYPDREFHIQVNPDWTTASTASCLKPFNDSRRTGRKRLKIGTARRGERRCH